MRVGQSKQHSAIEAILNILIGFGVAYLAQILIFPLFGIYISQSEHLSIVFLFTLVSFIRSYFVRRLFNYLHLKEIL